MMFRKKIQQLIENDLDNILKQQKQEKQGNPVFDNFDVVLTEKLRQHEEFMQKVDFKNKK